MKVRKERKNNNHFYGFQTIRNEMKRLKIIYIRDQQRRKKEVKSLKIKIHVIFWTI